jgi:hypothetical protein
MTQANPDQLLLELCARAAELEAVIAHSWSLITGAPDDEEPDDLDDIYPEQNALFEAIVRTRATTLAGLVSKAKVARLLLPNGEEWLLTDDRSMEDMLMIALVIDLLAMEGVDVG